MGHSYQRAVGLALAAQAFPAAPQAEKWTEYAEAVWQLVEDLGDITEDAPNYNRIDLTFLWLLADTLGKTEQLRAPTFRETYRRFASQVSPSGVIASYVLRGTTYVIRTLQFAPALESIYDVFIPHIT